MRADVYAPPCFTALMYATEFATARLAESEVKVCIHMRCNSHVKGSSAVSQRPAAGTQGGSVTGSQGAGAPPPRTCSCHSGLPVTRAQSVVFRLKRGASKSSAHSLTAPSGNRKGMGPAAAGAASSSRAAASTTAAARRRQQQRGCAQRLMPMDLEGEKVQRGSGELRGSEGGRDAARRGQVAGLQQCNARSNISAETSRLVTKRVELRVSALGGKGAAMGPAWRLASTALSPGSSAVHYKVSKATQYVGG